MNRGNISHIYRDGRHYDCLFSGSDTSFWLNLAERMGGPILELGCGTGKIAIPLAEAGFQTVGIDLSEKMLEQAYARIGRRELPLSLHLADMTDFSLSEQFNLIILPSNNLCHLLTFNDAERCFQRVAQYLNDDGVFVIGAFVPNLALLTQDPAQEGILSEYEDPDGRGKVVVATTSVYEPGSQIRRTTTYTRIPGCAEVKGQLDMRMYFPQELQALLYYNGFEVVEKYGSYNQEPSSAHSPMQIIVAEKRGLKKPIR